MQSRSLVMVLVLSSMSLAACSAAEDGSTGSAESETRRKKPKDAGASNTSSDAGVAPTPTPTPTPDVSSACSGPTLSREAALARFPAGSSQVAVGEWSIVDAAWRSCNELTGCGAWTSDSPRPLYVACRRPGDNVGLASNWPMTPASGGVSLGVQQGVGGAEVVLELTNSSTTPSGYNGSASTLTTASCVVGDEHRTCQVDGHTSYSWSGGESCSGWIYGDTSGWPSYSDRGGSVFGAQTTGASLHEHCADFPLTAKSAVNGVDTIEYRATLRATY